jgi:hypothetical protein
MWLAKYLLPLVLRKISRGRVGLLGTAVKAGGARRSAPCAAKGYLDWKLHDRAGQTLAVRVSLLLQGPGQLAVGRPGNLQLRVPLLQPRQQLGVRLFQAGDLALKPFLVGGGTEARLPPCLLAHQLGQPALPRAFIGFLRGYSPP